MLAATSPHLSVLDELSDHLDVLWGALVAFAVVVLLTPAVGGMARRLGERLYQEGYAGVFCLDFLVDTDDGLVVIASDCVGPLPEYFERMDLPEDFGPERDELLEQWKRIRDLDPAVVIPGHNPPVKLR